MEEKSQEITEDLAELNLYALLQDSIRALRKLWPVMLVLILGLGLMGLWHSSRSYTPIYRAEATFTVETHDSQNGFSFYYNNQTASQMALTFPFILDSDLLLDRVRAQLETDHLQGTPGATVVANSNLFTLYVSSADPQAAYDILLALIENYPTIASYVIGKIQLNMIDGPSIPTEPYNRMTLAKDALMWAAVGFLLSLALLVLYTLNRTTVRNADDVSKHLHTEYLGSVPLVLPKRRSQAKNMVLSIRNRQAGIGFQENLRGIALRAAKLLDGRKVLLVTSAQPGEGVSVVASNIAVALAEKGSRVMLLDGNFHRGNHQGSWLEHFLNGSCDLSQVLVQDHNTKVWHISCTEPLDSQQVAKLGKKLQELIHAAREAMDYIIIDAPPCENLEKLAPAAELSDATIFVIRHDSTKLHRIMHSLEDLSAYDTKLLGCVINGVQEGIGGYGYGYGYGYHYGHYGSYGRYGRYGSYGYGYGEKKKSQKER